MQKPAPTSDFLNYLASYHNSDHEGDTHLPSIQDLSKELGMSVAALREQLEVARALGFVEVRPRTGIRRMPYSFTPAIQQSLAYALALDQDYFTAFTDLRNQVEAAFWREAVQKLRPEDLGTLYLLLQNAWEKLYGSPVQIPHTEHRQLHLAVFSRLDNPFVIGILEAYWGAYEAVGLNVYADYEYHQQVWTYHQQMVDAISSGDLETGYLALVEHKNLLYHRQERIHNLQG